jgi:Vacuolar protein sorting-associated protein 62
MAVPTTETGDAVPRRRGFGRFAHAPWWVHVLATLAALLVLNVVGVIIAGSFFVDFVHEHGPPLGEIPRQSALPAVEERALAERFAPVLKLDSKELFVPIRRGAYVRQTQLKEEEGRFTKVLEAAPVLARLPHVQGICVLLRGCHYFLDVRGVEPDPPKPTQRAYGEIQNHLMRTGEKPAIYAHVTRYDDSGHYAVQYWFLYLFNYRLNEHESDWEQITVRLDEDKQPIDVLYSAHAGGNARKWSKLRREGDHPVVYPALGSHANYFTPGKHRVQILCKRVIGSLRSCLRGRKILVDVANGRGKTLGPGDYSLLKMSGPIFVGSYGSGNYVILTRKPDILADPRARGAWADPLRDLR